MKSDDDPVSPPVTSQPEVTKGHDINDMEYLPLGLKVMRQVSEVRIQQHIDPAEVILGCCARPCRYSVYPGDGEDQFLYIQEVSDCYARQFLGSSRGFSLKFSDMDQVDVARLQRPQVCGRGCCGCCICCDLPSLQVQTPPGSSVGHIKERRTCCRPGYVIYDDQENPLYDVIIRNCANTSISILQDVLVEIQEVESDTIVAQFSKQSRCSFAECVGSQNNFTIKYLTAVPVKYKILILGSMFLLDFHYFERQNRCCC